MDDRDIVCNLNNLNHNVIMYPGGSPKAENFWIKTVFNDLKPKSSSQKIREFVANGGGYIGSCYGAYKASCCMLPFPFYFKRSAYNPNLRSIGVLALSDIITVVVPQWLDRLPEEIIINFSHPVTYGLNNPIYNIHAGGPKIVYVGENSEVIAVLHNATKSLNDTPCWVSSNFQKGKVMIFSTHPEIVDSDMHASIIETGLDEYYEGKKIICNSLYYTTSGNVECTTISCSKNLSHIEFLWNKSKITVDNNFSVNLFSEIFKKIGNVSRCINELTNATSDLIKDVENLAKKENVDVFNTSFFYLGWLSLNIIKSNLEKQRKYLNDVVSLLKSIERIYPLNNGSIPQDDIDVLKESLIEKIDLLNINLENTYNKSIEYSKLLKEYSKEILFKKAKNKRLQKSARDFSIVCGKNFVYTSVMFFDSRRFIKEKWYNYESSTI